LSLVHDSDVYGVDVYPDGKKIASITDTGEVYLWNVIKYELIVKIN